MFGHEPDHLVSRVCRGRYNGRRAKMKVFLVGDPKMDGKMDFAGFMKGYTQFFGTEAQPNLPARSAMQVVALVNPSWLVEIEVTVVRK